MSTTLFAASHVFSANKKDELPMTIHVGMVGSDGIVLAGDTLTWDNPHPDSIQFRQGLSTSMNQTVSKIKIGGDRKVAVSCAGYLREAYPLAESIIANLSLELWEHPETHIQQIAKSYAASRPHWRDTQFLVLLSKPVPAIYLLDCVADEKTNELLVECRNVPFYAFDGDALNGAIFWAMRYYRSLPPEMRTLQRLMRLAAQIVADAGTLNSGNVGGLEMIYCDSTGIRQLTNRENADLLQEAQQRSDQIQQLILGE